MPVVESVVTAEKLGQLLAEEHESACLDYKTTLDLSQTRDTVELAKDVGAMQVNGGYIVIGADDSGRLTGELTEEQAKLLDESVLRPKMLRYIPEPIDIHSAVHTVDAKLVAILYVGPSPMGLCIFRAAGNHSSGSAFRAGDVYARHGSSSEPWRQSDVSRILDNLVAARKEGWRREFAEDLARSLPGPAQRLAAGPASALNWQLDEETFVNVVIEQLRAHDGIPLNLLLDQAPRQVRDHLNSGNRSEAETILHRLACLAAIGLRLASEEVFQRAIATCVRVYDIGFDEFGNPRSDMPVNPPAVWLDIIRHVYGIGALAVRLGKWTAVEQCAFKRPRGLARGDGYDNWLRHALTMAARSGDLEERMGNQVKQLSLLGLARITADSLPCLVADTSSQEELLDSLVQFDAMYCVGAVYRARQGTQGDFYPSFSRYYSHRSDPALRELVENGEARAALFPGTDAELAAAMQLVLRIAQSEAIRFTGWHGVQDEVVREFLGRFPESG